RAGSDIGECSADAGRFCPPAGRHTLAARTGPCGIWPDDSLAMGDALRDGPDDRARWRPASCLADAGCNECLRMNEAELPTSEWSRSEASETLSGAQTIALFVKRLPQRPGVYRMLN